jgi:hypothetical protein
VEHRHPVECGVVIRQVRGRTHVEAHRATEAHRLGQRPGRLDELRREVDAGDRCPGPSGQEPGRTANATSHVEDCPADPDVERVCDEFGRWTTPTVELVGTGKHLGIERRALDALFPESGDDAVGDPFAAVVLGDGVFDCGHARDP